MNDAREGPGAALLLVGSAVRRALRRGFAIGRRPRQREHVVVKLAGLVLAAVLCGRRRGHGDADGHDEAKGPEQRERPAAHRSLPTRTEANKTGIDRDQWFPPHGIDNFRTLQEQIETKADRKSYPRPWNE